MQTLNVDLGDRSYPIHIGSGLLKRPELIQGHIHGTTTAIVSNETIAPLYLDALHQVTAPYKNTDVILPDGEKYKTFEIEQKIFTEMLRAHCDRKSTLLALGGGVVGDMTGFAAACYQRGIPFIQVPTTLLAMVDSSVGGKTGVNHPLGKNMIGAFHQPQCVLIDIDTLDTLDDQQLSAGLAEVIKYGFINDPEFLDWLDNNMQKLLQRDKEALTYAIYRSCQHKADIVAADEREAGQRALLNLGHTFGHAIETGMGYGEWLHGEAIAVGMVMAAELSQKMGWIEQNDVERVKQLLLKANLPIEPPKEISAEQFAQLMSIDKKVQDGVLSLVLMKSYGESIVTSDFDQTILKAVLNRL
ncbi:MAG TPA: 3-dehydroquinate synthase [Leucothrix mucor]|uniref:3-dehydroquinate synthase n=1 Tax=Leucothrix mucor TaxID=45248 RepID=A0A7V2WUP7_LEUMU|nr:3-dehydroquinate synthase [Leucothrix mucor]